MALRTPWLARHSPATYIASSLKAPRSRMSSNCSGLVSSRSSWMGGLFNHSENLALRHSGAKKAAAAAVPFLMVVRASTKGAVQGDGTGDLKGSEVRVRFAPSPTGNLHVGGARTALFNYLYAKSVGGKFILRIEDTDLERSTKESEDALIEDLHWLGLEWDEGPFKDGDVGPYRQSERTHIYKEYANKLLASGHVYRCFCTDEELEAMREDAKAKNMPPRYMGKWGTAKQGEIDEELGKGTPFTYRFRVPQEGSVTIHDLIRGEVSWKKDTLGDFVVMRSNGQPVYNFCVAVDDATMKISHVIRAEEHLPNTLRQALIYNALGFSMPQFGHVSLILAPDRSKLSKRHGATSCGQFREMGYLSSAMVNYLALLGWNDGSEDEIFSKEQIVEKFSIDRITKSGAIFDQTKLGWLNGQHLRMLPNEEVATLFREQWVKAGILDESTSNAFIDFAVELLKNGTEVVSDSEAHLLSILHYPLNEILASPEVKEVVDDNIAEVAKAVVEAYDSGELQAAIDGDHEAWNKWIKGMGKAYKRKGKRLFMPVRVLLTGGMKGPEVGSLLSLVREGETSGAVTPDAGLVPLADRIQILRGVDWGSVTSKLAETVSQETEPALSH